MKYSTHISPTGWVVARTCSKITNPYLYRLDNMQAKNGELLLSKLRGEDSLWLKLSKSYKIDGTAISQVDVYGYMMIYLMI
jgi:hypothetical protein